MADTALSNRKGLPDALRVLLTDYPRDTWEDGGGVDPLTQFWLERHLMFRRLMKELRNSTEMQLDRAQDPRSFAAALARYGGTFVNGLHEHHTIEDQYYFPKLAENDSRILVGFDLLEEDHQTLDARLTDFTTSANSVLQGIAAGQRVHDATGQLHDNLLQLEGLLDRHLTDEEDLIVPVILRYGAPE